ncbi:MAG: hypothetical protein GVY13_03740 [Alphaproteobacteria bacterium]|jgi:hypothetical protein|nr:hypothetical protein [Alphaproteobacteria bacterium]
MRSVVSGIVSFAVVALGAGPDAAAEDGRIALLIGNTDYQNLEPVRTASVDARALTAALSDLGFTVETAIDLDAGSLSRMVQGFSGRAPQAEVALIGFFGRGQQGQGGNLLLPIDTRPAEDPDWASRALPLSTVITAVAEAQSVGVVLVDAARDNDGAFGADAPQGLAAPTGVPGNVVVSYSARPGNLIDDGYSFSSAYATALSRHLEAEGVQLSDVLLRVRQSVINDTTGEQESVVFGNATTIDFVPNPAPEAEQVAEAPPEEAADPMADITAETPRADVAAPPPDTQTVAETTAQAEAGPGEEAEPVMEEVADAAPEEAASAETGAGDGAGDGAAGDEVDTGWDPFGGLVASTPRAFVEAPPPSAAPAAEPVAEEAAAAEEVAAAPTRRQVSPAVLDSPDRDPQLTYREREAVQEAMRRLGLYDYVIDAIFGPITRAGMRRFQEEIGAEVTGYLSEAQIEELYRRAAQVEN